LIRTANDDKAVTSTSHLKFTVSANADVYVVWDLRISGLPAWLNDGTWTATADTCVSGGLSTGKVYRKSVVAGQVTLGGNLASPASVSSTGYSQYLVVVKAR